MFTCSAVSMAYIIESSFQSRNTYFNQKHHPYTGNLNSKMPGGQKIRFYIVEMF